MPGSRTSQLRSFVQVSFTIICLAAVSLWERWNALSPLTCQEGDSKDGETNGAIVFICAVSRNQHGNDWSETRISCFLALKRLKICIIFCAYQTFSVIPSLHVLQRGHVSGNRGRRHCLQLRLAVRLASKRTPQSYSVLSDKPGPCREGGACLTHA